MADAERRLRELESERHALRAGLAEVRADVERIGTSRAWRWGHAAASLSARLRRRPPRTEGGVARALDRIGRLERELGERPAARAGTGFRIVLGAPSREAAAAGGDLYFARALARALEQRGHAAHLRVVPAEAGAGPPEPEVVVVLRGRARYVPRAEHVNVLWCISHPDELTAEECDGYDLVGVASEPFAAELRAQTSTPVIVLHQATDPDRFRPDPDAAEAHELVFVGNTRGARRKILADLGATRHDLAVYGAGWDGLIEPGRLVAEHVPNERLRRVYSSAAIVLADHWPDMRRHGFASNRLYDAVACGALVISDAVAGVEERFAGAVRTYETPEELAQLVDLFLADPVERRARGDAGRRAVLAQHTFAHRVDTLLHALEDRVRPVVAAGRG
jgi:glycosyltransferase involved in cell wall biosynthesis